MKPVQINDKDDSQNMELWKMYFHRFWGRVFGIIITLLAGISIGLSCRTMLESYIYSCVVGSEGILCGLASFIFSNKTTKSTLRNFFLYLLIIAILIPSTCWCAFDLA